MISRASIVSSFSDDALTLQDVAKRLGGPVLYGELSVHLGRLVDEGMLESIVEPRDGFAHLPRVSGRRTYRLRTDYEP